MNIMEMLLLILSEEGTELSQATIKALRFGVNEKRDLPTSNRERMQQEFNDILAMIDLLNEWEPDLDLKRDDELVKAKKSKVFKYVEYSRTCGTVDDRDMGILEVICKE